MSSKQPRRAMKAPILAVVDRAGAGGITTAAVAREVDSGVNLVGVLLAGYRSRGAVFSAPSGVHNEVLWFADLVSARLFERRSSGSPHAPAPKRAAALAPKPRAATQQLHATTAAPPVGRHKTRAAQQAAMLSPRAEVFIPPRVRPGRPLKGEVLGMETAPRTVAPVAVDYRYAPNPREALPGFAAAWAARRQAPEVAPQGADWFAGVAQ